MHWSLDLLVTSAKEAVVFSAIGAGIAFAATLVATTTVIPAFGFVLLLEATALMLVGGALDMSSSGSSRFLTRQVRLLFGRSMPTLEPLSSGEEMRKAQFTAAIHSVTGVMLLTEAAVLALVMY